MRMASEQAKQYDLPPGTPGSGKRPDLFKSRVIEDGEMTPNGNSVVLEEQMMKVAETQAEYQSAIEIYRKGINLLRIAVRS
jgi:flagellar basal-body rod protein FlgB